MLLKNRLKGGTEAILHFQKALQLDPDEGEIEDNLGDALFRYGQR